MSEAQVDRKNVQVRMDPALKKAARAEAGRRDVSLSEYIRQLIREDTGENNGGQGAA